MSQRKEASKKELEHQNFGKQRKWRKPEKPKEGYLPLHQHQRFYYNRKRKGKRCWKCKAFWYLKENCPRIRCWYCGYQGQSKKKCFRYELHIVIKALKKIKEIKVEEPVKKKQKVKVRYKIMEFWKGKEDIIMSNKGIDLTIYSGKLNWKWANRGFESPRLPRWKMERNINNSISCKLLKLSDYLPHQCSSCGDVVDGHIFITHCDVHYRNYCPEGSLINASPYRFWHHWFDDANFLRFMDLLKKPQFNLASPPCV